MGKLNHDIRNEFEFFQELLSEEKKVQSQTILLEAKSSNKHWLHGRSSVVHKTIEDSLSLIIERSNREGKYGIKLRCKNLSGEPFIRFDSDGPAHRNTDPAVPLEDQVISTPHFNTFDNLGRSIAYKSESLKKQEEADAISNDINFGVTHFCIETNTSLDNGNYPAIVDKSPEIEFEKELAFQFKGVNFE
jgi:hypothetical protein